jgi:hypothetical protein
MFAIAAAKLLKQVFTVLMGNNLRKIEIVARDIYNKKFHKHLDNGMRVYSNLKLLLIFYSV